MGNEGSQSLDGKKLDNDVKVLWRKLERCPYEPREGQSCAVSGKRIFFFGGALCSSAKDDTGEETNQLLEFDIGENAWREVAVSGDVPEARSGSSLTAVDNNLYMFGGLSGNRGWLNDMYIFDIVNSRWRRLVSFKGEPPSPRDKLTGCSIGNSIYFFGGFGPDPQPDDALGNSWEEEDDGGEYEDLEIQEIENEQQAAKFTWFGDVCRFDIESNSWTHLTSGGSEDSMCPTPRAAHSMCAIGKDLIVFGGRDSVDRQNDLWSFSCDTHKWTKLNPTGWMPPARSFHAAASVGERMVVLGGRGITNIHFRDFHVFDMENNQWLQPTVEGEILPPSMGMHSLACVEKDVLLCFGTSDLDPVINSCTTHHQDCYAVATENILSGGETARGDSHEVHGDGNSLDSNALHSLLNLQPSSRKKLDGV